MREYHLNVLSGEGNSQKLYVVQSGNKIPEGILQLAGLLLDQGLFSNEQVAEQLPGAQMYVSVTEHKSPKRPTSLSPGDIQEAVDQFTADPRTAERNGYASLLATYYVKHCHMTEAEIDEIVKGVVAHPQPKDNPVSRLRAVLGIEAGAIGDVLDRATEIIKQLPSPPGAATVRAATSS